MSKAYLAAKEKYDAVISNPGRRDSTGELVRPRPWRTAARKGGRRS
jgi:hypothetical protein